MGIEAHTLSALVGRYTNSVVNEQANLAAPLLGKGVMKKMTKPDKVGIVNIKAGEMAGVKFLADGTTLPQGRDKTIVQGSYLPVALLERIRIPRMAAMLASSASDGVDIVKEQMDTAGQTLGRTLERGIFGSQIGSPVATVTAGSTSFLVADVSPYRVGMGLEVWNGSTAVEGTSEASLITVTKVTPNEEGDSTIEFSGSGSGGGNAIQWLTTYTFHLRGSKDLNATLISLADVCSTNTLLGVAATSNEWHGNTVAGSQPLTVGLLRQSITSIVRRRGEKPSHFICNRKNEERYSNLLLNNRRFMEGKMDARGTAAVEIEGIPLFQTENLGDSEGYLFNDKDVKLHVFRDFAPDFDGKARKEMGAAAFMVSDNEFVYDVQVWGAFQLRPERRNGCLRFTGLTN
jgi:hypothetical protein